MLARAVICELESADDQPAKVAYLREHEEVADRLERATRRGWQS
ncbi:hypothetical protein [Halomontanus rarus]|nr:hypothetical protein [Halovivax sp. TS33]